MHPDLSVVAFTQRERELLRSSHLQRVAIERAPQVSRVPATHRLRQAAGRLSLRTGGARPVTRGRSASVGCCAAA